MNIKKKKKKNLLILLKNISKVLNVLAAETRYEMHRKTTV